MKMARRFLVAGMLFLIAFRVGSTVNGQIENEDAGPAAPPTPALDDSIFGPTQDTGVAPGTNSAGTFGAPATDGAGAPPPNAAYSPTPEETAAVNQGKSYFDAGDYEAAAKELTKAVEANQGKYAEAAYLSGRVLNKLEQFARAADMLQRAANGVDGEGGDPSLLENKEYLYELAFAQAFAVGAGAIPPATIQEALTNIEKALDLHGTEDWADALYVRGVVHKTLADFGAEEDYQLAYDDLHKAIALDGTKKEFYLQLGLAYFAEEKFLEAVDAMTQAIDVAGAEDYLQGRVSRSAVLITIGKTERDAEKRTTVLRRAIEDCAKAAELDDEQPASFFNRALAHRYLEEYDDAIRYFTETIRRAPSYAEAYLRRGIVWFYLGDYGQAAADFDYAITISPGPDSRLGDSRALHWRALTHSRVGEYAEAIRMFNMAISQQPAFVADTYLNLGLAYFKLGDFRAAIRNFDAFIRDDPLKADGFYYRGLAQARRGDWSDARLSLERAARLDPTDERVKAALRNLPTGAF